MARGEAIVVRFEVQRRIQRSQADVFDFTCRHVFENNPKWEDEVIEWRYQAAPAVGVTATMVRKDSGKVHDVPVEIVEYDPDRSMTSYWRSGPLAMRLRFTVEPAGHAAADFVAHGEMQVFGPLKLLAPLFRARSRKLGERLVGRIKTLLESPATVAA
jgi:hypothetical protein